MAASPAEAAAVLEFWFTPPGRYRPEWFRSTPAFDEEIHARFGALVATAVAGGLMDWEDTAEGALARIVLLDQFTRNIFRQDARAYAGDAEALAAATRLVASGRDKNLPPLQRWFTFMPFEHSESLIDQERSVALFAALRREAQDPVFDSAYDYALRHREVIERFGRFPARNATLGRRSTAEEAAYLAGPHPGF